MRAPMSARSCEGLRRRRSAGWSTRMRTIVRPRARVRSTSRAASTSGSSGRGTSRVALPSLGPSAQDAAMDARAQSAAGHTDGARPMSGSARSAGVRRALLVVLVLNALSAAIKIAVGARTGALTVLGAALESVLDMLSNIVAILAVSVASREPDEGHPYGHDKFETLGTLGIVGFLSISCF